MLCASQADVVFYLIRAYLEIERCPVLSSRATLNKPVVQPPVIYLVRPSKCLSVVCRLGTAGSIPCPVSERRITRMQGRSAVIDDRVKKRDDSRVKGPSFRV